MSKLWAIGQRLRQPFGFIFYNFLGDIFAFDTRFFRTFVTLISKPGLLSKEYFDGRRVRYSPPFRIFIFASFLLFFLLQNYSKKELTRALDSNFTPQDNINISGIDSIETRKFSEELFSVQEVSKRQERHEFVKAILAQFKSDSIRGEKDLRQRLKYLAEFFDLKQEIETDPIKKEKLRELAGLCRSPENALSKIYEYISWAFFVLLPIFALLLKFVYLRQRKNYMRHLIFSIHFHSFIFIVLIFLVVLITFFHSIVWISTEALMILIPLYFILAVKKFYGQSILKIILKSLVVFGLYNIVLSTVILIATLQAIGII